MTYVQRRHICEDDILQKWVFTWLATYVCSVRVVTYEQSAPVS
jgi:hypothetical protein